MRKYRTPLTEKEVNAILQMHRGGATVPEICAFIGISKTPARYVIKAGSWEGYRAHLDKRAAVERGRVDKTKQGATPATELKPNNVLLDDLWREMPADAQTAHNLYAAFWNAANLLNMAAETLKDALQEFGDRIDSLLNDQDR